MTTLEVRVYVGTYAKYNNGSIFGQWLTITADTDMSEFWQQCKDLHKDEDDPEFMIQDWEAPELLKSLVSECHISNDIPESLAALEGANNDPEVYEAYAACFGASSDIADMISKADDAYMGEYDSDEDFAQQTAEDTGAIEAKVSWPHTCIDWEWAARELMYDYCESNGHYFTNY